MDEGTGEGGGHQEPMREGRLRRRRRRKVEARRRKDAARAGAPRRTWGRGGGGLVVVITTTTTTMPITSRSMHLYKVRHPQRNQHLTQGVHAQSVTIVQWRKEG